jgi:small-conductance mechanosensitive channel
MLHRWLLSLALCLFVPFAAIAQTSETIDYDLWKSVATRAETAVDGEAGTNEVFETLRTRIVNFRTKFSEARLANVERIATLQAQMVALGAVPENGVEPLAIATQRSEISLRLAELQAPVQAAEVAYRRADGLIGEIDTIIRERQTNRLLSLGPSPLNPVNWGTAISELVGIFVDIKSESRLFSDSAARQTFIETLPFVIFFLVISVLLMARARRWTERLGNLLRKFGGRGTGVWSFILSVIRVTLQLIGVAILSIALQITGMLGLRGEQLIEILPIYGIVFLCGKWLADWLFPREDTDPLIEISEVKRLEARFDVALLSALVVLRLILDVMLGFGEVSEVTSPILHFPLIVCVGILLFRVGHILRGSSQVIVDDDGEERITTFSRVTRLIGLGAVIVSVLGPLMAAVGYFQAGDALVFPAVYSLAVFGLVLVLQRFLADVYGWISGQGVLGREALIPALAGFGLLVLATPPLALIWGARVADLTELWSGFLQGFAMGETRISPSDFITFAVLFTVGYLLTRLIQGALRNNVLPKTKIDKGGQNAIVSGLGYVGIFLAAVVAITGAGIDLSSLAIVAGALSVGIGFGLQNIVSNFVSGIILLIERPISEGDWIEVGGKHGYVRAISVRSTRIETFDRTDVIVPNADLVSGTVTNYTRGNTIGRLIMNVGVAYGTDTKKVEGILREIAKAQPMVLANPAPFILFSGFGADSLDFEIRMILRDVNWSLTVKNDVNHQILARFVEEGIEMPFAQRDIWIKNPEALVGDT